jgi:hypothetical protein
LPTQVARPFIRALQYLAEDLPDQEGLFGIAPDIRLLRIAVKYLAQYQDIRTRGQLFMEMIEASEFIVLSTYVISNEDNMKRGKPSNTNGIHLFEDDQLEIAKGHWIEKVHAVSEADPDDFLANSRVIFILYRWREWEPGGPGQYLERVVTTQSRALILLTSLAQRGESYQSGDFAAKKFIYIRLSFIEDFIPLQRFIDVLNADTIDKGKLNKEQAAALAALRDACERRAEGRPEDDVAPG